MEPRRCGVHGLVVNADGRCVICRRGDPAQAPKKTSGDWPIVLMLGFVGILLAGTGAFWVARAISNSMATRPPPPVIVAPEPSATTQPVANRDPFANERRASFPDDPSVASQPASTGGPVEMTQERLEQLMKRVKVTMYVRRQPCNLCDQARGFLTSREIPVNEVDIDASPTDKVVFESKNPAGTIPTFDVDGKILVGYDVNVLNTAIEKAAIVRGKR